MKYSKEVLRQMAEEIKDEVDNWVRIINTFHIVNDKCSNKIVKIYDIINED